MPLDPLDPLDGEPPRVPTRAAAVAVALQLALTAAVGTVVVRALALDPCAASPGALGYLVWCVAVLRRLAVRSTASDGRRPARASEGGPSLS